MLPDFCAIEIQRACGCTVKHGLITLAAKDGWQPGLGRKPPNRRCQSVLMELEFKHALMVVGAILVVAGAAASAASYGPGGAGLGMAEALSQGFTIAFFALFSGVLAGVGTALVANGFVLGVKSNAVQAGLCVALSAASVGAGALAVMDAQNASFLSLALFFAGIAAGGAFLLSAMAFAMSGMLRK